MIAASAMRISVVVTTYNDAEYLTGCLGSLTSQSLAPFEIIVIDDGSTEEASLRHVDEAAALFPKARIIRQKNAGPSAARNRGLDLAAGELIAFVDVDDRLSPDCLATRRELMARGEDIAAAYSGFLATSPGGAQVKSTFRDHFGPFDPATIGVPGGIPGGLPLYLFRADALRGIGGLDEALDIMEDFDALIRLGRAGGVIVGCNAPLYLRTLRPKSLSRGSADRRLRGILRFLAKARRERYFTTAELVRRYAFALFERLRVWK